jgi:hypothetical protein
VRLLGALWQTGHGLALVIGATFRPLDRRAARAVIQAK